MVLTETVTHEIIKQEGEQPKYQCIVLLDYWAKLLDTFLFWSDFMPGSQALEV